MALDLRIDPGAETSTEIVHIENIRAYGVLDREIEITGQDGTFEIQNGATAVPSRMLYE